MKRFLLILILLSSLTLSATARVEKPIDPQRLPRTAQQFLRQNYRYAIPIDAQRTAKGYTVVLNELTYVDFDRRGQWAYIQSPTGVPDRAIPLAIKIYISRRHEGQTVVQIQRTTKTYTLQLSNGLTLTFDNRAKLLKVE